MHARSVSCCSEDIFQFSNVSRHFCSFDAHALSLFCAQFEEVYIYTYSRRGYREQQRAQIVQRERERDREKSLFDDDLL